jgi:lipopolysaccharide export system protein LptA
LAFDGTRLTVTSVSNNKMFVEVDGRRYNFDGNTVSINSIRLGTHTVRVLREMKRKAGRGFGNGNKIEETVYNIKVTFREGYHFDILSTVLEKS